MKITTLTNGPYLVQGVTQLVDQTGTPWVTPRTDTFALCRCGHSATKPLCDGSHRKRGFEAPAHGAASSAAVAKWEDEGGGPS